MNEEVEAGLKRVDSPYRAVLITARRAKQLQRGSEPVVEPKLPKYITIAMQELADGKIEYEVPPEEDDLLSEFSMDTSGF